MSARCACGHGEPDHWELVGCMAPAPRLGPQGPELLCPCARFTPQEESQGGR